jgi:hypothetical protein
MAAAQQHDVVRLPIFTTFSTSDAAVRANISAALAEFSFVVLRTRSEALQASIAAATSEWSSFFARGGGDALTKLGCSDARHQWHSNAHTITAAARAAGATPQLAAATEVLSRELAELASALCQALGVRVSDDSRSVFDVWRYFGTARRGAITCGDHVDPGIFTVEPCAGCAPGLQIFHLPSGTWLDVEGLLEVTSDIIFFAAAQLAERRPAIAAARHRVASCAAPRLSLAYELRSSNPTERWNG